MWPALGRASGPEAPGAAGRLVEGVHLGPARAQAIIEWKSPTLKAAFETGVVAAAKALAEETAKLQAQDAAK